MEKQILTIIHLTFIALFIGGQGYTLSILIPSSYSFFTNNSQLEFFKNTLKKQNPILLLYLFGAIISGGLMISGVKANLGQSYFAAFGVKLINKLLLFFVLFFSMCYQTLIVGFKAKYTYHNDGTQTVKQALTSVRLNLAITAIINIGLTVYILFYAMFR